MNLYEERKLMLQKCVHFIKHDNIAGDYLEFGVYVGDTLFMMYELQHEFNLYNKTGLRLIGFDSFQGFPANDENNNLFNKGKMCADYVTVRNRFPISTFNHEIHFVKGFYSKTLTPKLKEKKKIEKAAIINIDCDLYQSTKEALEFSTSLLQQGTLLILDDWFCFCGDPNRGEQRAFREWETKQPYNWVEFLRYGAHGKVLLAESHK